MSSREDLARKAAQPAEEALRLHPFYRGKVQVLPKCPVRDFHDFAIWYTPGVAAASRAVERQPELVWEHTNRGNLVAIVSDGTRAEEKSATSHSRVAARKSWPPNNWCGSSTPAKSPRPMWVSAWNEWSKLSAWSRNW